MLFKGLYFVRELRPDEHSSSPALRPPECPSLAHMSLVPHGSLVSVPDHGGSIPVWSFSFFFVFLAHSLGFPLLFCLPFRTLLPGFSRFIIFLSHSLDSGLLSSQFRHRWRLLEMTNAQTSQATSRDEGMNPTQFQQLMAALLGAVQSVSTAIPPLRPRSPHFRLVTLTKSINWSQMPKLDLARPGELDFWFISLEGRLRAAQVPESHWAEKVMECPGVDESVKMRLRQLPSMEYALIRQSILKDHGPIDPMDFFLRAIHRVKGTYREDVREQLTRLLTVFNRAAADEQRPGMSQRDLCYPFLESFPASVSQRLEQQLALVFVQDDPFAHLFRLSPARPVETSESI